MGLHFLVVDDSELNLSCTQTVLKNNGITSDLVTSAEKAYKLLAEKDYDLVLLDFLMPETNGIVAAAHIRRMGDENRDNSYYKALPLVALTAEDDSEQQQLILQSDYNDLVSKPFTAESLSRIIAKWCGPKLPHVSVYGIEQNTLETMLSADQKSFMEIANLFVADVPEKHKRIDSALASKDYQAYTVEVHRVKGEAKVIGAVALAQAAAVLEAAGKSLTGVTSNEKSEAENLEYIGVRTPRLLQELDKIYYSLLDAKKVWDEASEEKLVMAEEVAKKATAGEKTDGVVFSKSEQQKLLRYVNHALESLEKQEYDLVKEWLSEIGSLIDKG